MRLLPREEKFFQLFMDHADLAVQASDLLLACSRNGETEWGRCASRIKDLEHRADEILHEVVEKLRHTFITPFDPEDIHRLASAMDDVMDGIEESAYRLGSYGLTAVPPAAIRLCELVGEAVLEVQRATQALSRERPVTDHCVQINHLEDAADRVFREAVSSLFHEERDPIMLLKLKEIYEALESTTDRCEDAADVLQNIMVKSA